MPIRIHSFQPPQYYLAKHYIPVVAEAGPTVLNQLRKLTFNAREKGNRIPLFRAIEIETHNRCNNDCPFCPASRLSDKRPFLRMSEPVFSGIADQLRDMGYSGTVSLYHNNEPLLDERLPFLVREIKEKVVRAKVSIWTNGILLSYARLKELHSNGLARGDSLVIDDYSYTRELSPRIARLLKEIKATNIENEMDIKVWIRDKNAILTNRAGRAPNKKGLTGKSFQKYLVMRRWCPLPFTQFNVNPAGLVHICCYDAYYDCVVGDVTKESIPDIWHGSKLNSIRSELNRNGRWNIFPCNVCDSTV